MPREEPKDPKKRHDLAAYARLTQEADKGRLDDLVCPKCEREAVSVWFTHPAADTYRTWFICGNCDFHSRAQHDGRPPFFSDDRVSTELQERDLAILRQLIFKRPPQQIM